MKAASNDNKIIVPRDVWSLTWSGLRKRGGGKVESAALWGGKREGPIENVEAIYFLDDLAGHFQHRGYHYVPPSALARLFDQLRHDGRVIIADIHTHPTAWVGLSELDKEHPIEFRPGLHAIVLPSYAKNSPSLPRSGVHEYEGDGRWRTLSEHEKRSVIKFT